MGTQIVSRRDIATSLSNRPIDELWSLWLRQVQSLEPFWLKTVDIFATRSGLADDKRDKHLHVIANAFEQMDDWRFHRVKYIKAQRNEIDSAISFIRNKALENQLSNLVIAPAARNAASALRMLLTASCRGYSDRQFPECFAGAIYDIAAVHVLFPFDFGSLSSFHPGHSNISTSDPFVIMLEQAGQRIGIQVEVQALFAQVCLIWNNIYNPTHLNFQDTVWTREGERFNAQLHYTSQAAFHKRP